jgi:hypothetical protein
VGLVCQSPIILKIIEHKVRFEVFTAVPMKNGVFWDVTPCGSCKNRCFGGTQRLLHRVTRIGELGTTLRASVVSYS